MWSKLKPCFHASDKDVRQSVKPSLAGKNGLPYDGLSVSLFTVYTAIISFFWWRIISHHPARQSVLALERKSNRSPLLDMLNGLINGLTERNMGTVVFFLYLFVSLPVCWFGRCGLPVSKNGCMETWLLGKASKRLVGVVFSLFHTTYMW